MTLDLAALRAVAEAATQQPWKVDEGGWGGISTTDDELRICETPLTNSNTEYIAAFDPPTALALLDALEAAQAEHDRLAAQVAALTEALQLIASKKCLHEPWRKSTFQMAEEALAALASAEAATDRAK